MKKIAVVDRISDLPESLLYHILSFLPTKKAVTTSLLSSRWKLLWTLVLKLDLDSENISTPELLLDDARESAHLVAQCEELQSFRVQWQFGWDSSKRLTSLMAESNSERQTLYPGKDAVVDRINSLPEPLLCHILSFLATKESIATSILSTRWKLLWTLVPKLDLNSDEISTLELSLDDEDA